MAPLDPIVGGALVSGAASLFGNLLGFGSNNSTNKTNLKIAQMNNQFNERMLQKQMDYNTQMWNAQNEYNTPTAQVQRLKNAGLNPALMMGQGQTGTAEAAGGVTPPTASPATMQSFRPDFSGIGEAAQTYAAMQLQKSSVQSKNALIDEQRNQVHIENQYKAQQLLADIAEKIESAKSTKAKTIYQEIENSMRKQMLGAEYELTQKRIESVEQQTKAQMVNTMMMSKELSTYDERTRVAIANQNADTLLKLAQKKVSEEQAKKEIAQTLLIGAQQQGLKISNDVASRTADYIVKKARNSTGDVSIMGAAYNGLQALFGNY